MDDKNIIIQIGDSWAAGAWGEDADWDENGSLQADKGVCQYLTDQGFSVRNLASPGGSNAQSIHRLQNWLECNPHDTGSVKCIFFWYTEFPRDTWFHDFRTGFEYQKEINLGYSECKSRWTHRPFFKLAKIYQRWHIPIYVLGGCSDCVWYEDFQTDFPGIKIICQSVTNLLLHGDHQIQEPIFVNSLGVMAMMDDFLALIKPHCDSQDLELLVDDLDRAETRRRLWQRNPGIFADKWHPDEIGQRTVFEYLLKHVPELGLTEKMF